MGAPRAVPHAAALASSGANEAPSTSKDVAALLRSHLNASAPRAHTHCHCVLALLDLQKTGSTQLEKLVHGHRYNGTKAAAHHHGSCRLSFLSKETRPPGWRACTHHGDSAHRAQCARANALRLHEPPPTELFLLTMLRDPVERLYSEWQHLKGDIVCFGNVWNHYAPASCNGTVLLPGQRWAGEPAASLDAYRRRWNAWHAGNASSKPTFEDWLAVDTNCAHNRMTRQLAIMPCEVGDLTSAPAYPGNEGRMLAMAKEALAQRVLFGLTERYAESVHVLNRRLAAVFPRAHPLSTLRLPTPAQAPLTGNKLLTHGAGHSSARPAHAISAGAREIIARRSALDVALYAYATRLFERLRADPGLTLRPKRREDTRRRRG